MKTSKNSPYCYSPPQETGFYYLQSRYYDPNLCRFINADVFASTGQGFIGTNMFAYCLNNPVNLIDPSGSYSYISINGIKTEYVGLDEKNCKVYRTTIQYTNDYYDDIDNSLVSSMACSASITFTISTDGIVSIDNSDNPQWILCDDVISTALAKEILGTTKRTLLGRSIEGIAREIRLHYIIDKIDKLEWFSSADSTEIGSVVYGIDSYDYNASGFEHIWEMPRILFQKITGKEESW